MRGLTAASVAVVGAIVAVFFLRSGPPPSEETAPAAPARRVQVPAAAPKAMERSARVEERLNEIHGDFEHRQMAANPAPNRRELPTVAAAKRAVEELAAINEADPADDPEDIVELKQTLLSNPDPEERIGAVLMLTGEEGPESLRALLQAMNDPNAEVRLAVVEALGDRSEDLNPAILDRALRDPDPEVRFEAVSILGDMETPEARERVRDSLHDEDDDVRALAEGILDFDEDDFEPGENGQARN